MIKTEAEYKAFISIPKFRNSSESHKLLAMTVMIDFFLSADLACIKQPRFKKAQRLNDIFIF